MAVDDGGRAYAAFMPEIQASPGFQMRLRVRLCSNQSTFLSIAMRLKTADTEPHNSWWRIRRCLVYVRDWPENGNGPYSLMLCLSLLLAVGLMIKIGH
jgi:hypothetical protein